MKKFLLTSTALLSLLFIIGGCSSNKGSSTQPSDEAATKPSIPIPPGSPFAKLKEGMSEGEVTALIGQPTSTPDVYATGKAWIPFHFSGSDDARKAYHYKGEGIVIFSLNSSYGSSYSVIEIDYDPNEPGFAK